MKKPYCEPADIKIYVKGKGVMVSQKSLIAYEIQSGKIIAFGNEAGRLTDYDEDRIRVISPIKQGAMTDYICGCRLLAWCLSQAGYKKGFSKPDMMLCLPKRLSEVDKKAYEEAALSLRARNLTIYTNPFEGLLEDLKRSEFAAGSEFGRLAGKCKYIIGITKDEPRLYIKERLAEDVKYAREAGMDKETLLHMANELWEE